jgi:hypothetical protein
MRQIAATFLAGIMAAGAQQQPPAPSPDAGVTKISATFNMVVETVTVNDKNGKAIDGLKAEDFTVTENGAPQKLQFCEFQRCPSRATRRRRSRRARSERPPKPPENKASVTGTQIAPETPGDLHYRNKRLLALYFDMSAMPIRTSSVRLRQPEVIRPDHVRRSVGADAIERRRQSAPGFHDDRDLPLGALNKNDRGE